MSFETSISVTNSSEHDLVFHLEPWGAQIRMPAGAIFNLHAEAELAGSFEIDHLEREIIVWAWPTSVVRVSCDGEEVAGGWPAVPPIPEGQTVSSFLKVILGKKT